MDIIVCVKIIPDPNVVLLDEAHRLDPNDRVDMINPSDHAAVGEALRLQAASKAGSVTVISIAPPPADALLRRCLAMGVNRAVRLWDESFDSAVYNDQAGMILACMVKQLDFDLILCGHKADDDEMGFTGYRMAEALGLPFIASAVHIDALGNDRIVVTGKRDGGMREIIEAGFPVIVAVDDGRSEPLYPDVSAMISAFRSEVETLDLAAVDLTTADVRSKIKCLGLSPPRFRAKKIFLPDSDLPAPERLRQIMNGGIIEKKDALFEGDAEELSRKFVRYVNRQKL